MQQGQTRFRVLRRSAEKCSPSVLVVDVGLPLVSAPNRKLAACPCQRQSRRPRCRRHGNQGLPPRSGVCQLQDNADPCQCRENCPDRPEAVFELAPVAETEVVARPPARSAGRGLPDTACREEAGEESSPRLHLPAGRSASFPVHRRPSRRLGFRHLTTSFFQSQRVDASCSRTMKIQ